jgi:hypothetical protein
MYQIVPARSAVMLWGREPAGSVYSFISPVRGLRRPTMLPYWPAHQIVPSAVCTGSRERWPRVGTIHSLNVTVTGPETSTGSRPGFGGKCVARYCETVAACASGSLIIVEKRSCHFSLVYPAEPMIWLRP